MAVLGFILDYLEASKTWRSITEEEGRTNETYTGITCGSQKMVPVVCRHCGCHSKRSAVSATHSGCGTSQCKVRRPHNVRLQKLDEAVAKNLHTDSIARGDAVEQEIVDALRSIGVECSRPALNGTWDIILQVNQANEAIVMSGIQVKKATRVTETQHSFSKFNADYPQALPLVVRVGMQGPYLVATCGTIRNLRVGVGRKVGFSVNNTLYRPFLYPDIATAVIELLRLSHLYAQSEPLTPQIFLDDLTPENALEQFSFMEAQRVLKTFGEILYRHSTTSNAVDAMIRLRCRCQLKCASTTSVYHDDVYRFNVSCTAGMHGTVPQRHAYHEKDFDWLILIAVDPWQRDIRNFVFRHFWFVPMSRLVEHKAVRTDADRFSGLQKIHAGVPGHKSVAIAERQKLPFPNFEDCYNNAAPLIAALNSGVFGDHPTSDQLRDHNLLNAFLSQ